MFREVRLGDDIDDFCVRCKRVMNHAVVSVVNGVAAKVRCRTCHNDHDFRHEQPPPPKVDARKAALFNEVLKTVDPTAAEVELDPENVELHAESPDAEAPDAEAAETEVSAMAASSEPAPEKPAKAAKAPAKGKTRAKK